MGWTSESGEETVLRGSRRLTGMYSYLIVGCRGGRARLFPEVHRGRTQGNKHKLEFRNFLLKIMKKRLL